MKASLILALLGTTIASTAAPNDSYLPLEIEQTSIPQFPTQMSWRGHTQGEARIALAVDENGQVTDVMPVAYTKRAFADEAIRALKSWRYRPIRVNGEPHPGVAELHFSFESQGVVVQRSIDEMVSVYLDQSFDRKVWDLAPTALKSLDRIPTPIKVVPPQFPKEALGQDGRVTVLFIIDQAGKVRFPSLRRDDASPLGPAALAAVRQWEFEPPTRDREPVIVRASQEFVFVSKKAN